MSGGNDALYQQAIKDLAVAAHGAGHLAAPDAVADLDNPFCGDRIHLEIGRDGDVITALAHKTRGCLLCRASAAIIGLRAPGRDAAAIAAATTALEALLQNTAEAPADWPELSVFVPARAHPSRHGCALLPFRALLQALAPAP
jgi:nitrogen fixation NifU-like protein